MRTQPLPENDGNTQPIEVLADGLKHEREAPEECIPCQRKSFQERVREFEHGIIAEALEEAGGGVTKAARALGLTHQGLCYIINHRHKELLTKRAPISYPSQVNNS